MLESLFGTLCKIGTFLKISKNNSPSKKAEAKASKNSIAAAISGDGSPVTIGNTTTTSGACSPVFIGGNHVHHSGPDFSAAASEAERARESKFKHNLILVANELPNNFRNRGNAQQPFLTEALKKIAFDETTAQMDPTLSQMAVKCLNVAESLSNTSSNYSTSRPSDGQHLMKELSQYIIFTYGIGPRL